MRFPKDPKRAPTPSAIKALMIIIAVSVVLLLLLFGSMACTMTQTVEISKVEGEACMGEDATRAQVIIGNTVECDP